MGRKMRTAEMPPTDTMAKPPPEVPTLQETAPKRGRGRPRKIDVDQEARDKSAKAAQLSEAERKAAEVTAADVRPIVDGLLATVAQMVKGEPPTDKEIDMVSGPLAAVSNKYSATLKYYAEISLLASLLYVTKSMHKRGMEKRALELAAEDQANMQGGGTNASETQRDSGSNGPEGVGQISVDAIVGAGATP